MAVPVYVLSLSVSLMSASVSSFIACGPAPKAERYSPCVTEGGPHSGPFKSFVELRRKCVNAGRGREVTRGRQRQQLRTGMGRGPLQTKVAYGSSPLPFAPLCSSILLRSIFFHVAQLLAMEQMESRNISHWTLWVSNLGHACWR